MQLEQKEFWDGIMVNYKKTLHLLLQTSGKQRIELSIN